MGRNTNPDQKNRQTNKPDVELTERQFKVLDMIISKPNAESYAEVKRKYNEEFRKSLSYSQVRTTIKNLKNKGMVVPEKIPSGPVYEVKGRDAWDAIIMVKMSSLEEKPVEQVEETRNGYKIWI